MIYKRLILDGPENIFDITTTETGGYWEDLLKGRDLGYLNNKRNLKGRIVYMTPNEYYREAAKVLSRVHEGHASVEGLKTSRSIDQKYIKQLEEVITKKHEKFPIPVLDISDRPGQEGLHRMMVAGNLYGWNTKFPVLLIENYSSKNPEEVLKSIVNRLKQSTYKDYNQLFKYANELMMNSIFHENFDVNATDDETQLYLFGEYNNKTYEAFEDFDEFEIEPSEYSEEYEKKKEDKFLKQLDL